MVHGLLYMTFIAITWMFCFNAFSCGRRLKIHKVLQNLFLLCPWHLLEISHILWLNFKVWRVSEGSWCSKHGDLGAEGVLIQICDENFFSNFNRNYSNFCTFCAYASTRGWRLKIHGFLHMVIALLIICGRGGDKLYPFLLRSHIILYFLRWNLRKSLVFEWPQIIIWCNSCGGVP